MGSHHLPWEELCKEFGIVNCTCDMFTYILHGKNVTYCPTKSDIAGKDKHNSLDVMYGVITSFACFIGVFGNLFVVFAPQKRKLSRHRMLVNALAMCDFIFSLFAIVYVTPRFWTAFWLFGELGCKILSSTLTLGSLVAIGMIMIIAIERYFGIVHPLKTGIGSTWRLLGLCTGNIIMAILATTPRIISLNVNNKACGEVWENTSEPIIYSWCILVIYFIVPLTVLSILYRRIYVALNRSTVVCHILSGLHKDKQRRKRVKENRRTITYLVVVLLAFFLFTLPNKLKWLVFDMVGHDNIADNIYVGLYYFGEITYFFHMIINPLVYTVIDRRFRRNIKKIFVTQLHRYFTCFKLTSNELVFANDVTNNVAISDDQL